MLFTPLKDGRLLLGYKSLFCKRSVSSEDWREPRHRPPLYAAEAPKLNLQLPVGLWRVRVRVFVGDSCRAAGPAVLFVFFGGA